MRHRVHLVVDAHLVMSPRAQREAAVLQAVGHEVTLSGVWFDPARAALDVELARRLDLSFQPALDLRPCRTVVRRLAERAKGCWARARFRWTRAFSPPLLGHGVASQLDRARRIGADLTIVHGEAGLWIACQLRREKRRVGVDFEDWFSRDLPVDQRVHRPVHELERMEKELLSHAFYRVASSAALANALVRAYDVTAPKTVTNAGPVRGPDAPRPRRGPLRIHWFSQTIGPARGLELLLAALPLVKSAVRVELRGACRPEHRRWIERLIPVGLRESVVLSDPVPPWELPIRLADHDVGLALETSSIPSRDVCIPNKFFHYLAGGLAVIATSTAGHREAMAPCPEAGVLVDETSPADLAAAIDRFLTDPPYLAATQAAARAAALGPWSGEDERHTIVAEAERALTS